MSAEDYLKESGIFDHLTDVLLTVLEEQPSDAVDVSRAAAFSAAFGAAASQSGDARRSRRRAGVEKRGWGGGG